jgi:hypothetical protein
MAEISGKMISKSVTLIQKAIDALGPTVFL